MRKVPDLKTLYFIGCQCHSKGTQTTQSAPKNRLGGPQCNIKPIKLAYLPLESRLAPNNSVRGAFCSLYVCSLQSVHRNKSQWSHHVSSCLSFEAVEGLHLHALSSCVTVVCRSASMQLAWPSLSHILSLALRLRRTACLCRHLLHK